MVVPDALRVVAGAGAATAVGFVYYNPALPSGQIFIAQMKKSGKALEFDGQTKVALATSVACAAGLAALYVARAGDKSVVTSSIPSLEREHCVDGEAF